MLISTMWLQRNIIDALLMLVCYKVASSFCFLPVQLWTEALLTNVFLSIGSHLLFFIVFLSDFEIVFLIILCRVYGCACTFICFIVFFCFCFLPSTKWNKLSSRSATCFLEIIPSIRDIDVSNRLPYIIGYLVMLLFWRILYIMQYHVLSFHNHPRKRSSSFLTVKYHIPPLRVCHLFYHLLPNSISTSSYYPGRLSQCSLHCYWWLIHSCSLSCSTCMHSPPKRPTLFLLLLLGNGSHNHIMMLLLYMSSKQLLRIANSWVRGIVSLKHTCT